MVTKKGADNEGTVEVSKRNDQLHREDTNNIVSGRVARGFWRYGDGDGDDVVIIPDYALWSLGPGSCCNPQNLKLSFPQMVKPAHAFHALLYTR